MEISKSKMFKTLYLKDLMLAKNESLLILGFILIGNLFLYYKAQTTWPLEASFTLSIFLLIFVPLSIFFRSFSSISSEWKENTVYLMMSLPVSGAMILFSKLMALMTRLVLLVLAALPFTLVFFTKLFQQQFMTKIDITVNMVLIALMYFILIVLIYNLSLVMAFFSTHIGKLVKKFSGLVTFLSFIVVNYVVTRVIEVLYRIVKVEFISINSAGTALNVITVQEFLISSFIIIMFATALFFITARIYERKLEL